MTYSENIRVVTPSWSAPHSVQAATTTRHGGVSERPFASLNLGAHVTDQPAKVERNRDLLGRALKLPDTPVWLNQTHSNKVIEVFRGDSFATPPDADAVLTRVPGTVCAVLTADCMPLLLCSSDGCCVAAVHAGWRGMATGVIENALAAMDVDPAHVIAWAGPTIGPAAFEIGSEVREQLGGPQEAYTEAKQAGKWYANLYLLAAARLAASGVTQYSHSAVCTFTDHSSFYSYRRDGQCGRMASLVWIKK